MGVISLCAKCFIRGERINVHHLELTIPIVKHDVGTIMLWICCSSPETEKLVSVDREYSWCVVVE